MASSSFTSNLGLCNWAADDRPKRADFVSDNQIIDTALGGHIADAGIHLTQAEKEKALVPYISMVYAGNGEDNRAVITSFAPKFVMVFKRYSGFTSYENGITVIHAGAAAYGNGGTEGVSINSSGFTVRQQNTAVNGRRISLNENDCQYMAVLFK